MRARTRPPCPQPLSTRPDGRRRCGRDPAMDAHRDASERRTPPGAPPLWDTVGGEKPAASERGRPADQGLRLPSGATGVWPTRQAGRRAAFVGRRSVVLGTFAVVAGLTCALPLSPVRPAGCVAVPTPSGRMLLVAWADTPSARAQGLAHRDGLTSDGLFLDWPSTGHHPIWMAGMRVPLDLIWLDADDRIAGAVYAAQPCDPAAACPVLDPVPAGATRAVLELPAGQATPLGLTPGVSLSPIHRLVVPCASPASPRSPHRLPREGGWS